LRDRKSIFKIVEVAIKKKTKVRIGGKENEQKNFNITGETEVPGRLP
jgi:hypothetical protein